MNHVYVEPHPSARLESAPITCYVLLHGNGQPVSRLRYKTLDDAIDVARSLGFNPLVALVRITDKRNPTHWRSAKRVNTTDLGPMQY